MSNHDRPDVINDPNARRIMPSTALTAVFSREALPLLKKERGSAEGSRASDKHRNSALVPLGKCSDER